MMIPHPMMIQRPIFGSGTEARQQLGNACSCSWVGSPDMDNFEHRGWDPQTNAERSRKCSSQKSNIHDHCSDPIITSNHAATLGSGHSQFYQFRLGTTFTRG
jgi:hypothetical protein